MAIYFQQAIRLILFVIIEEKIVLLQSKLDKRDRGSGQDF